MDSCAEGRTTAYIFRWRSQLTKFWYFVEVSQSKTIVVLSLAILHLSNYCHINTFVYIIHSKEHLCFMRDFIETELMNLSVSPGRKGYDQMVMALEVLIKNGKIYYVTKELYPVVAEQCGVSAASVERNIRGLIKSIWRNGNADKLAKVFGSYDKSYSPSNKEFLFILARRLDIKLKQQKARAAGNRQQTEDAHTA